MGQARLRLALCRNQETSPANSSRWWLSGPPSRKRVRRARFFIAERRIADLRNDEGRADFRSPYNQGSEIRRSAIGESAFRNPTVRCYHPSAIQTQRRPDLFDEAQASRHRPARADPTGRCVDGGQPGDYLDRTRAGRPGDRDTRRPGDARTVGAVPAEARPRPPGLLLLLLRGRERPASLALERRG